MRRIASRDAQSGGVDIGEGAHTEFDAVAATTGYDASFPFMTAEVVLWKDGDLGEVHHHA